MVLGKAVKTKTLIEQAPGGRVELRHPRWADFEDWSGLRRRNREFLSPWEPDWSDKHLTRNSFKARLAAYNRMAEQGSGYPYHIFAGAGLRLVGACNITRVQQAPAQSAQLGYWVGEEHARQGFARGAIRAALKFCYEDLGLHRVEAAVQSGNLPSINLLAGMGFQHEGTARSYLKINGEWRDHEVFSRLSSD